MADNNTIIIHDEEVRIISQPADIVVHQRDPIISVISVDSFNTIVRTETTIETISVGIQGPTGPLATVDMSAEAGMNISSYHAVVLINGLLYHADYTDPTHADHVVGIASQSGLSGTTVNYRAGGELSGGTFVTNSKYFVGAGGALTATVPQPPNWLKSMAIAKDNSTVIVELGQTILRG